MGWKSGPGVTWSLAYKAEKLADKVNETKTREFGVWSQVKF